MALLVAINVGYRVIVIELSATLDAQLGEQLGGLAETFATSLDPDAVAAALSNDERFDADAYLTLRSHAADFATVNRLVSATILDTVWRDPFSINEDSLGQKVYSLLDSESGWALRSGLVWVSETFRWEGTYYRSAAAPIEDPVSGELLAIARIEVDAQHFGALSRLEEMAWWIHALSGVLAISLFGLFLWYGRATRRWENELLHSEKLIGLGRLSATIAHEIKNPLGIIKATAQRLGQLEHQGASADKRTELLGFIPEEVDRLDRIVTRYLSVGQFDSSNPVPINVGREIPRWIEMLEGKVRVQMSIQDTMPILADPEAPRQVLINLVKNAIEASPAGESVIVEWGSDREQHGILRVKDHGPGIPRKQRREVFEPFHTTKATGSGLGLFAAKTLVERDGGTIAVEDNEGGGAVFVVRWPLVK